jgi:uncharacterized protein YycO
MRQRIKKAGNQKNRTAKRIIRVLAAIFLAVCLVNLANWIIEGDWTWKPDYQKTDLAGVVIKDRLTDADYHTIFMQTGLGRDAADELRGKKTGGSLIAAFERYQKDFFAKGDYQCRVYVFIVHDERMVNEEGKIKRSFQIADLRDGDILISKSTHSFGWRHGHAAIVTNAAEGETMEALLLGNPAILDTIAKWETYTSFIQLRLKNHEEADTAEIAEYAKKNVLGVPYGLLTGIPVKSPDDIKQTQCAHLVWYPYEHFGYDLDSDGSWLVTPKDIASSNLLEVVQVYGVNPEEIWK